MANTSLHDEPILTSMDETDPAAEQLQDVCSKAEDLPSGEEITVDPVTLRRPRRVLRTVVPILAAFLLAGTAISVRHFVLDEPLIVTESKESSSQTSSLPVSSAESAESAESEEVEDKYESAMNFFSPDEESDLPSSQASSVPVSSAVSSKEPSSAPVSSRPVSSVAPSRPVSSKPVSSTAPSSSPASSRPVSSTPVSSAASSAVSSLAPSSAPVSSAAPSSSDVPASSTPVSSAVSSEVSSEISPYGTLTVRKSDGTVVTANTEEILAQIVEAEMGSSYPIEALKAQAVATYSYILNKTGITTQPMKTASKPVKKAVEAVLGQVLLYDGKPINAMYSACTAGKTANVADIFGGKALPYLVSVDSAVDLEYTSWQGISHTYTAEQVRNALQTAYGFDVSVCEDKSQWISVDSYDANNLYVKWLRIYDPTDTNDYHRLVRGYAAIDKIFTVANTGFNTRSYAYTITYDAGDAANPEDDTFTVTTYGYGHGVGMSQYGAKSYANQGYDYEWILNHYYPNATLSK